MSLGYRYYEDTVIINKNTNSDSWNRFIQLLQHNHIELLVRWIIIVILHVILNVNWFMVVFDRLWSGRAITEYKYVFLFFFVFFFACVYMYLCMSPIISIIVLNCLSVVGPYLAIKNSYYIILYIVNISMHIHMYDCKCYATKRRYIYVINWALFKEIIQHTYDFILHLQMK